MHTDSLSTTTEATHDLLRNRLRVAEADNAASGDPRIHHAHTDTFMATASRRVAAVDAILVPAARRTLPDAEGRVHDLVQCARALERTLATVKARLYGEAHNVGTPWSEIWPELDRAVVEYLELESSLVDDLAEHMDDYSLSELAVQLHDTELTAPSRPHPYTPHTGVSGRVARSIWASADRFWDAAEGRIIPEPVHPHHKPPGLIAQYFLADPQFDLRDADGEPTTEEGELPSEPRDLAQ